MNTFNGLKNKTVKQKRNYKKSRMNWNTKKKKENICNIRSKSLKN